MIELTERAREALAASAAAAMRLNPDARIRLTLRDGQLRTELAEGPEPGERVMEVGGVSLIVHEGLEGTIDAADHNTLSIRRD